MSHPVRPYSVLYNEAAARIAALERQVEVYEELRLDVVASRKFYESAYPEVNADVRVNALLADLQGALIRCAVALRGVPHDRETEVDDAE